VTLPANYANSRKTGKLAHARDAKGATARSCNQSADGAHSKKINLPYLTLPKCYKSARSVTKVRVGAGDRPRISRMDTDGTRRGDGDGGTEEHPRIARICAKQREDVEPGGNGGVKGGRFFKAQPTARSLAPIPRMNFSKVQSCMHRSLGPWVAASNTIWWASSAKSRWS
jgi:hypothetical protein